MSINQPLRQLLIATRNLWDRPEIRPAVRQNFDQMINCQTPALGAEVYASEAEERVAYHTCKSRACPSCGYRATILWQREQWAALPDIPYAGLVFTMPSTLWPIFKENRHLLHDLPAVGAAVLRHWAKSKYGVRLLIMVVQHTFGGYLNFNCHLHVLVSAGGLRESDGCWTDSVSFDEGEIMEMWRDAVITYLFEALKARVLASEWDTEDLERVLMAEFNRRRWIIYIHRSMSKLHFLGYAARYARRPPIAQSRLLSVTDQEVEFRTKDKLLKRWATTKRSSKDFVLDLAEHVPDRYRHAVRYFGLWAPTSKAKSAAALFVVLGQKRRPRPRRLSWAYSLRRYFGVNPLIDSRGQRMRWVKRLRGVGANVL